MDARVHSVVAPTDPFANDPLRCAIDTDSMSLPPTRQFGFFQTWYAGAAEVELLRAKEHAFPARQQVWQLGDLALSATTLPGSGYDVRWTHRKRPLLDHWVLNVPLSRSPGDGLVARKPGMTCLATPDEWVTSDDLLIALFLPRTWPATRAPRIEADVATLSFLAQYAVLLHGSLPHLKQGDVPHIVSATADLFATALAPCDAHSLARQGPVDAVTTARLARFIAEKLSDRSLTPDRLCRSAGISRSRLYRIFQPAGGVSNYIRRKRLLKTRDALADSSERRAISAIAEEWGFTDPSVYSRMFKEEFGMSPTEARDLGWQGIKHSSWLSIDRTDGHECALSDLLINNSLGLSFSSTR